MEKKNRGNILHCDDDYNDDGDDADSNEPTFYEKYGLN